MVSPEAEGLPPERLPRRLATVRFYVDEDLWPVGHAMMWARTGVIVCGAEPIIGELPRGKPDVEWIPIVAAHDWIVVTGNDMIHRNPEEPRVAVDSRLRAVCPQDARGDLTGVAGADELVAEVQRIDQGLMRRPVLC